MAVPPVYDQANAKLVFEFDVPKEVAEFMKKHNREAEIKEVLQKIISEGISTHVNKALEEIERLASYAKDPQISLREGQRATQF